MDCRGFAPSGLRGGKLIHMYDANPMAIRESRPEDVNVYMYIICMYICREKP